jgi:glycerol uptake facilitator-like aquaporin
VATETDHRATAWPLIWRAQLVGGIIGAALTNLMFGLPVVSIASHHRTGAVLCFAEAIATAGLILIIGGASQSGHRERVAVAVGAYITAGRQPALRPARAVICAAFSSRRATAVSGYGRGG